MKILDSKLLHIKKYKFIEMNIFVKKKKIKEKKKYNKKKKKKIKK